MRYLSNGAYFLLFNQLSHELFLVLAAEIWEGNRLAAEKDQADQDRSRKARSSNMAEKTWDSYESFVEHWASTPYRTVIERVIRVERKFAGVWWRLLTKSLITNAGIHFMSRSKGQLLTHARRFGVNRFSASEWSSPSRSSGDKNRSILLWNYRSSREDFGWRKTQERQVPVAEGNHSCLLWRSAGCELCCSMKLQDKDTKYPRIPKITYLIKTTDSNIL
jgi:hypothetical protein